MALETGECLHMDCWDFYLEHVDKVSYVPKTTDVSLMDRLRQEMNSVRSLDLHLMKMMLKMSDIVDDIKEIKSNKIDWYEDDESDDEDDNEETVEKYDNSEIIISTLNNFDGQSKIPEDYNSDSGYEDDSSSSDEDDADNQK